MTREPGTAESSASRHALIVGGTRGIGKAVAAVLGARGYAVTVLGRREPGSDTTDGHERAVYVDLEDTPGLLRSIDEVVEKRGPLAALVFCQRYRGDGDPWEGELEVTLSATRAVIEHVSDSLAENASVVAMLSPAGRIVVSEQPVGYHACKAALEQMVRYYAVALGPLGVRVNGVSPGTIVKAESAAYFSENKDLVALISGITPLRRLGTADDVAGVVAFLCGSDSAFVTGQNIYVDGGVSLLGQEAVARGVSPSNPSQAESEGA